MFEITKQGVEELDYNHFCTHYYVNIDRVRYRRVQNSSNLTRLPTGLSPYEKNQTHTFISKLCVYYNSSVNVISETNHIQIVRPVMVQWCGWSCIGVARIEAGEVLLPTNRVTLSCHVSSVSSR